MRRRIHNVITCLLAIFVVLSATVIASAQDEEYKEYTVKKGDSLWSISSKEVSDPFLWPKIWKENPTIKNPDLIYPGQAVRIPLRLTHKEVSRSPQPEPEKAKVITPMPLPEVKPQQEVKKAKTEVAIRPVEKRYLVDKDALISSGYISDTVNSKGEIISSPGGQSLLGRGDFAYIKTVGPASAGDRFYVIRSLGKVKHPETGDMIGYLIEVLGIIEIVGTESGKTKVRINASYDGIVTGDLLTDFFVQDQPFVVDAPRRPDIRGAVVATRELRMIDGMLDIAYIDKGAKDGLEAGDVLGIVSKNQYSVPNGSIQVISVKDKTATAIIRKSTKEVTAGDVFGHAGKAR